MTTTHTHTSGPWERSGCTIYAGDIMLACTYCEGNRHLHTIEEDDTIPDSTGIHGLGWDEAEANARLIAAAPEMLDALKGLLEVVEENYDNRHEVEAALHAIFKAEGRDA